MLPNHQISVFYGLIFLLLVSLFTGCKPAEKEQPESSTTGEESVFEVDRSLCNFEHKFCEKSFEQFTVSLGIQPFNTPSEKPLKVTLKSSKPLEKLTVRVEGRDMFMGVIPLKLNQTAENTYQGTLIYGSCSSNYMVWRLIASFSVEGKKHVAMYDFLADSE